MAEKTENIIASEELLIQQEFDALLRDYRNTNHRQKIELITKAFEFAHAAHKDMRRRSGEPYIMHPLAVARIVVREIGLGSTSICAALLHDVVEDTDYTVEDIEKLFKLFGFESTKTLEIFSSVLNIPRLLPLFIFINTEEVMLLFTSLFSNNVNWSIHSVNATHFKQFRLKRLKEQDS